MARLRLGDAIGAPLAIGDLHRGIAVAFLGLDLGDAIVGDIEHGHRHGSAVVGENPCHADLAADKSKTHVRFPWFTGIGFPNPLSCSVTPDFDWRAALSSHVQLRAPQPCKSSY